VTALGGDLRDCEEIMVADDHDDASGVELWGLGGW
jgi:hypothetical protein